MREVSHDNDHRLNQSYFRDYHTNRTIRIDSLMTRERARGIAALRGWNIVMWTEVLILPEIKKPGLWKRLLRRK